MRAAHEAEEAAGGAAIPRDVVQSDPERRDAVRLERHSGGILVPRGRPIAGALHERRRLVKPQGADVHDRCGLGGKGRAADEGGKGRVQLDEAPGAHERAPSGRLPRGSYPARVAAKAPRVRDVLHLGERARRTQVRFSRDGRPDRRPELEGLFSRQHTRKSHKAVLQEAAMEEARGGGGVCNRDAEPGGSDEEQQVEGHLRPSLEERDQVLYSALPLTERSITYSSAVESSFPR